MAKLLFAELKKTEIIVFFFFFESSTSRSRKWGLFIFKTCSFKFLDGSFSKTKCETQLMKDKWLTTAIIDIHVQQSPSYEAELQC